MMEFKVLFVIVLIFFSCVPVQATEINPSVEHQPFFCKYSITAWTPLCPSGGNGGATIIQTGSGGNTTIFNNLTISGNFSTISNYTVFNLVNITQSEMNQTPNMTAGPQGIQGIQGIQGVNGTPGPQGINGTPGPQGIQGEKGDKGDEGDKGDPGAPGADGPPGPTGPANMTAGPQGPAGEQGIQGIQGIQGVNGTPGYNGTDGVNGLDANVSTMFPIGSIYITTNATNPATLFGFGTWELIAPGRVIVGYNASDGRFNTIGNTGGNYTWQI